MKKLILILIFSILLNNGCKTFYKCNQLEVQTNEVVDSLPPYSDLQFNKCIDELKKIEGFRSKPYFDVCAMTIGYGHQITSADSLLAEVTEKEATELLIKDFRKRIDYVEAKYNLKGNKALALARFTFNLGTGNTHMLMSKPNIEKRWLLYCHIRTKNGYIKSDHLYKCRKRELELWKS